MFSQFNVNIRKIYLATSLYDCIEDNNINAIKVLLKDNEANPNIVLPDKGISPFHLIVGSPNERSAEEVTRLFLQYDGDPNVRSDENMTPVHVAAAWGRIQILELLLKCGGDPSLTDDEGKTPLDYALSEEHLKAASVLQEYNQTVLLETCQNNYNLTLEKVIINTGQIVAEYDANKSDNTNNFLNELPMNEVHSYVQNWCLEHAMVEKNDITHNIVKNTNETYIIVDENKKENEFTYFDQNVTRRGKKKYFNISDEYENIFDSNKISPQKVLNLSRNSDKVINISDDSNRILNSSKNSNVIISNSFIDLIDSLHYDISLDENILDINIESEKIPNNTENEKNTSQILENSFHYLDDSFSKEMSRESGVMTLLSDISNYQISLEPLTECQFIGTIDSDPTNEDEISKYTTCNEINVHEININSLITSETSAECDCLISEDESVKLNTTRTISENEKAKTNAEKNNVTQEIDRNKNNYNNSFIDLTRDTIKKTVLNSTHIIEKLNKNIEGIDIKNDTQENSEEIFVTAQKSQRTVNKVVPNLNCTRVIQNIDFTNINVAQDSIISKNLVQENLNTTHVIGTQIDTQIDNTHLNQPTGICQVSDCSDSNDTFYSVAEEYKYTDEKKGIVLIERRYLVTPPINIDDSKSSVVESVASSLPTTIDYDTETLRKELTYRGEEPGPITSTTKRVYLRRLMRLQRSPIQEIEPPKDSNRVYSVELAKTLRNPNWKDDLTMYKDLELAVVKQFCQPDPTKKWREGHSKASFTYLLMDPRITQNLPARSEKLNFEEIWNIFLNSIFYVGKGKRSRPYCHLYDAVEHWNKGVNTVKSKKIQHILDIWNDQKGVVCLHIFQNVIPVEAYTREAAIISAIKLQNLRNVKMGDFYGVASTWSQREKRLLGVYLLYRAMFIFLNEGERQLRPNDI